MQVLQCAEKHRNEYNQIIGYSLVDTEGTFLYIEPKALKRAIKNKDIYVINLILTQDNRLVAKKLNFAKVTPAFIKTIDVPKALSFKPNMSLEYIQKLCAKYSLLKNAKIYADSGEHLYGIETNNDIVVYSDYDISLDTNPIDSIYHAPGFFQYTKFTSIDVSNISINTPNMSACFYSCKAEKIIFGKFNTSHVTNMYSAFYGVNIDTLDLSGFDTSNVKDMANMFKFAHIKQLIIPFNTTNVYQMSDMFAFCYTDFLDLRTFTLPKITTNIGTMFDGCTAKRICTKNKQFQTIFRQRDKDSLPFD